MNRESYIRKKKMLFASDDVLYKKDILIETAKIEMYLENNTLLIRRTEEMDIFYNGMPCVDSELLLEEGDCISIPGIQFTFFDNHLELEGDEYAFATDLLRIHGENDHFEGYPIYKRSPRIVYRIPNERIELKAPPQKKEFSKGSLLQMIIPSLSMMAITVGMGIMMKRGAYVYMTAGMTVVTLLFSVQKYFSERKVIKKANAERVSVYEDYLLRMRERVIQKQAEEVEAMTYQYPTAKRLKELVTQYSSRIYERSMLDDDFLNVNLGFYSGKSNITVGVSEKEIELKTDELNLEAKKIQENYINIDGIPVPIDLKKSHLGLVGSKKNVHEQIKYILEQITFFHSYHDVQIIFIHSADYSEQFQYTKWYPHLRISAINVIADIDGDQSRDQILGTIQQMLKDRKLKIEEEKQETVFTPHLLFIIDEPKLIVNHAIMEYLQVRNQNLGFSIIYTTDQRANLPENIRTICEIRNTEEGMLLMENGERKNIRFETEHVDSSALEGMARDLSALTHEQGISSRIPESITFFELYNVSSPKELNIKKRWKTNESHKTLSVPLGVRAKDDFVELNLHEKAHGPHGLVAGTTGSGKSEIIQSYILSLAVNFHPHEVGFLLIDYKGGGMANLFEKLPHLLGTITNLDKSDSMRAMASIKSELARRQRIFGDCNVNHINGYNKLFKLGKVEEPLPHLFIISDEFAELKKEQPEFMTELVSAARIGRSLGIHLILATQKPSGVVDDQIWTNSKFKLCLKVQNAGDSKEMIKTPDAANITQAGRSYLQVGNNEIYELFQSAWSGAVYDAEESEEEREDDRVYLINSLGQGELINQDLSTGVESSQLHATQLDVVIDHIKDVFIAESPVAVKRPWLPPLARLMVSPYLQEIQDSTQFDKLDLTLGIGLMDIPEEQCQQEYVLNPERNGHMLYLSSSGYGKSVFLSHIILGLSAKNAVKNLNFYIIDLGNSALINLKKLPHVADYMTYDDKEKLDRFQRLILDEMRIRKAKFAEAMVQNFHTYNELSQETLPALFVALDNYDIVSELGDNFLAFMQKIVRDGASLGIYCLVTLTRESVMRSAVKAGFKEKIAGYNFEQSEIHSFIGRSPYTLPEDVKGRALVKTDSVHMMQLYSPVTFETDMEYIKGISEVVTTIATLSTEDRAMPIPVLPEKLTHSKLREYRHYAREKGRFPIGISSESLEVRTVDARGKVALILGNPRMGRTNIVKNILHSIGEEGQIYLFDSANEGLRGYQEQNNIVYANDKEQLLDVFAQIEEEIEERKDAFQLERTKNKNLTLMEFGHAQKPVHIIVDVVQNLQDVLKEKKEEKQLDLLLEAAMVGIYVIVTSDTKLRTIGSKFMETINGSSQGVILGSMKDQSVFSSIGIRENNAKIEHGYFYNNGKIELLMMAHAE